MWHQRETTCVLGSGSKYGRYSHLESTDNKERNPADNVQGKDRLEYWIKLAQLAEWGKINFIFFADSYGG